MDLIAILYELGMDIWNTLVGISMSYFVLDPINDSIPKFSSQVALIKSITSTLTAVAMPLVVLFFVMALIKECTGVPPDILPRVFFGGLIKYIIIVALVGSPLWVMQNVSSAASAVVSTVNSNVSQDDYQMDIEKLDVGAIKAEVDKNMESIPGIAEIITTDATWGDFFGGVMTVMVTYLIFFLTGLTFIAVSIASSISILNVALHRVLKPLILIPFTSVALAAAAGGPEGGRIAVSFVKTYVSFILSGAVIIMCIAFGAMMSGLIAEPIREFSEEANTMGVMLSNSIATLLTPVMISGLVTGADGMVRQVMG